MIKTVIRLQNGMVMVFDGKGEQVPEYQGQYDEVRESILRNAPVGTLFNHWFSHLVKTESVPRERW